MAHILEQSEIDALLDACEDNSISLYEIELQIDKLTKKSVHGTLDDIYLKFSLHEVNKLIDILTRAHNNLKD